MVAFLEDFEKRMEIVAVVESVVNRKNKNMEYEKWFQEHELTNLIFSVLLYIMEKTLSEDSDCDSDHIQSFISSILPYYGIELAEEKVESITHYILKNILQNEGVPHNFDTFDYTRKEKKTIPVRLIADRVHDKGGEYKITYSLTDQGYDFLFRTKEINQEIKMTIEELKLRELIKRKNFKEAQSQSLNLIQMVRQKKKEIEQFRLKIKENIHGVDIAHFEELMNSTYELLDDEYKLLSDIMAMVQSSEEKIREEYEVHQELDESLKKAQAEIKQIRFNIKGTLSEQKDLILSRQGLSEIYIDTISDSFTYSMENRFDLEEVILKQMEHHAKSVEHFWKLFTPLFLPKPNRHLNPRTFYEAQMLLKLDEETADESLEIEDLIEDLEQEKIEQLNNTYVEIVELLLTSTMANGGETTLADVIILLEEDKEQFQRLVKERILFTTVLKLYDIGFLDIEEWKKEQNRTIVNLSEEFNLEYCLDQLMGKGGGFEQITHYELIKMPGEPVEVVITNSLEENMQRVEKIEISNFKMKAGVNNEQH